MQQETTPLYSQISWSFKGNKENEDVDGHD